MIGLCRHCRKAVFSWSTPSMIDGVDDIRWSHFVLPYSDEHDAEPLPGVVDTVGRRVLLCPRCHRPQERDEHGWHCSNPTCHVDNG